MAEHNRAFIFIDGESAKPDLSNDKLSASLDACPRCKDKQKIIFMRGSGTESRQSKKHRLESTL